jgi:hypothetical protein
VQSIQVTLERMARDVEVGELGVLMASALPRRPRCEQVALRVTTVRIRLARWRSPASALRSGDCSPCAPALATCRLKSSCRLRSRARSPPSKKILWGGITIRVQRLLSVTEQPGDCHAPAVQPTPRNIGQFAPSAAGAEIIPWLSAVADCVAAGGLMRLDRTHHKRFGRGRRNLDTCWL